MKADGVLREVYTALSREPNVPKVKAIVGAFVVANYAVTPTRGISDRSVSIVTGAFL